MVSSLTDEYAFHYEKITLEFDKAFVDRYTGIEISNERIVKTLESLGFGVQLAGDDFTVTVPSWRATKDVTIKADIIEEITRIYGYDNFAIHTTRSPLYPVRTGELKSNEDKIKDILVQRYNLHEVHSYVWAYNDELKMHLALKLKTMLSLQTLLTLTLKQSEIQLFLHSFVRLSQILRIQMISVFLKLAEL